MLGGVYYTLRNAAKIPVAIKHVLHRDVQLLQGDIYCNVEGELSEEIYRELCQDTALELEAISYCVAELSSVGKSLQRCRKLLVSEFDETELKKRLINHDFLILKIQPGKRGVPAFYIWAEKVAGEVDGTRPGIHIFLHEGLKDIEWVEGMERKCCLHRIECRSHIGLGGLISVLKKNSPHYHARNDNCWDYARETTKLLLEACIQVTSVGCYDYGTLQKELKHLEANIVKNLISYNFGRAVKYGKSHVWEKLKSR